MNALMRDTLLDLFQQVIDAPERIPGVPIDAWQQGPEERQLLTRFRDMLERIQGSRQQAEEQLREREEQYRRIFEAVYDGIAIVDSDGFLVEVNPAFCTMYGYPYEALIGMHASVLTAPATLPVLDQSLEALKTGK